MKGLVHKFPPDGTLFVLTPQQDKNRWEGFEPNTTALVLGPGLDENGSPVYTLEGDQCVVIYLVEPGCDPCTMWVTLDDLMQLMH